MPLEILWKFIDQPLIDIQCFWFDELLNHWELRVKPLWFDWNTHTKKNNTKILNTVHSFELSSSEQKKNEIYSYGLSRTWGIGSGGEKNPKINYMAWDISSSKNANKWISWACYSKPINIQVRLYLTLSVLFKINRVDNPFYGSPISLSLSLSERALSVWVFFCHSIFTVCVFFFKLRASVYFHSIRIKLFGTSSDINSVCYGSLEYEYVEQTDFIHQVFEMKMQRESVGENKNKNK